MNSVPQHLLSEDRQEYERILDEALRSAPQRPELAAVGRRLNPEQLRTMALNATALITAAAASEYRQYVTVREELRRPAPSAPSPAAAAPDTDSWEPDPDTTGPANSADGAAETNGAGAIAVVAVLAPVLSGTSAAIFLLVGYVLRMVDPERAFARTLLTAGWVFGAVTAAAILVAAVGLLLTALRNSPTPEPGSHGEAHAAVTHARDAWHAALLERGILPFLQDALTEPDAATVPRPAPSAPVGRMPRLGYGRPGFSSSEEGSAPTSRPRFSSPDYTSPDFGGPEHKP